MGRNRDILETADNFSKRYNTKVNLFWTIKEWREENNLTYKDIHSRLKRRGVDISYVSLWRWMNKK